MAAKREVQSEITAPLTYRDRTVGVMQVLSYKTNAYDAHDLDLIMLIARQAAVAIENARLFDAQRSEQRQTEAAAELCAADTFDALTSKSRLTGNRSSLKQPSSISRLTRVSSSTRVFMTLWYAS